MSCFIFIFRRDLRIEDNVAYAMCLTRSGGDMIPIYIRSGGSGVAGGGSGSIRSAKFINDCIADLKASCPRLQVFEGDDLKVLSRILKSKKHQGIYFNADPGSASRDAKIVAFCKARGIECVAPTADYTLVDPATMKKPYQKFTPFYNKYAGLAREQQQQRQQQQQQRQGKRGEALAILDKIEAGAFDDYAVTRDQIWNPNGTTKLSVYLKHGCISIREAFYAARNNKALQKEFMWRSFYDQLAYWFPRVLEGKSLKPSYDRIDWKALNGSAAHFKAWKAGRTGFPLIDAGMRQLSTTGYMHNRLRMICASFLVKTLHIDWRRGEQWFATQLLDYYPASNNGGWQWASGSGADSQPYFRSFSPWIQSKKHDPDAIYIKTYVPELANVPAKAIHTWWKSHATAATRYPPPCVDHTAETKRFVELVKTSVYAQP